EIEVAMMPASGIERRAARRTGVIAGKIFANAHLGAASTASHRFCAPFHFRPGPNGVPRERLVAVLAGIVEPTAFHPDSHDIELRMPMPATRLRIELEAVNLPEHHCAILIASQREHTPWSSSPSPTPSPAAARPSPSTGRSA